MASTDSSDFSVSSVSSASARSFLFVLGSSRPDGNTEALARAAAENLPADSTQRWVDLAKLPLPDFQDGRHETGEWPVSDSEALLQEATMAATDVVLASPLYWYSLSAQTKRYLDYWSGWLGAPGLDFKEHMAGRTLWAVSVMSADDEAVADGMVTTLNNTAAYMGMRFGGVLFGNGSRPGQVQNDLRALERAETFFRGAAPLARFPRESVGAAR
ncbi:flavodoxin family protein [Yinghuangia soli]|uniref:NAD(P)H-dependent oxidoreductase n=1 Tax=Yinghuangia soli TaxID=2908204 RepID=A0AA41PZ29_9ACTN|nr:NAD(P)H-dependent oxidoreductase [Yinghuangia soli]MCF2527975.1 NAD(P)H-dependent oxidoreductase [Yinghuangia soli]